MLDTFLWHLSPREFGACTSKIYEIFFAVTRETTGAEDRMCYTQTSLSNQTFSVIVNISPFRVRDICNSHMKTLDSERKPNGKFEKSSNQSSWNNY